MRFIQWRVLVAALFFVVVGASCAPGTDGINIIAVEDEAEEQEADFGDRAILVELPDIPVIRLPELGSVGDYDELLQDRLGALASKPLDGIDVLTVECKDGETIYSGTEETVDVLGADLDYGETFTYDVDPETLVATYFRERFNKQTRIVTSPDGSGEFVEVGGAKKLSIEAEADGSGRYYFEEPQGVTAIAADSDGSGVYSREGRQELLTITIGNDGSGVLYSDTTEFNGDITSLVTITARADGSGELYYEADGRVVTLTVRPDTSWELSDTTWDKEVNVLVRVDGTGQYRERLGRALTLDFDADGLTGDGPAILLPEAPRFVVADRFPQLGKLASITPPCATILRFDSALLFAVNEATLLPEAASLLNDLAPALIESGKALEINGHTDATGSEDYNQDLSERRAQAVADALAARGVFSPMDVTGFGELQPVAPNYREDGSDDDAGQSQNRRVEIVIRG